MAATTAPPMGFVWSGEAMVPKRRSLADLYFVVGAEYRMVEHQDRSDATHRHEFAWLNEAWKNLPEELATEYPSPEHLRKRALIQAGFYDEQIIDAGIKEVAMRVAAIVRTMDAFAYIAVRGSFVIIRRAKSQARGVMDRKTFQDSKTKMMEIVSAMIGVTPEQLSSNTGKSA